MTLRALDYEIVPVLRAANGPVYLHPDDRKYGVLAVGGQGSGKTAVLHRLYAADIRDQNTAVVVMDPKSELARLALETTPPDCGKRVWYLDLGRPMFGMSPLRLDPSRSLPEQASAIADNIVQAITDTAEGQVFQSSRRYLYHAVIGALTLGHRHGDLAMFEDVFGLLLPGRADLREHAANACQEYADLDHTAEFFRSVLPDELDNNRGNTYQRLDPPRNKIETILEAPALRRFFNHPVDVPLGEIVEARDILIVDANMGAIGEENAQVCMHFIFRLIHTQMQRQIHMAPDDRPRVALICDEGSYIASRNVIKQIATHREAGLDVALGLQFFSQLGAGAQSASITDEIRKGATNLLQSRFLFRLGEPEDAEAATRIAMSVYQTMIRSDLSSRELLRITPEQSLYLPVWHCLASWIAGGRRALSFIGQTYAFPKLRDGPWARHHLGLLRDKVGPYPEMLPKTYKRTGSSLEDVKESDLTQRASGRPARRRTARRPRPLPDDTGMQDHQLARRAPRTSDSGGRAPVRDRVAAESQAAGERHGTARRDVRPLIREAGDVPEVGPSAVTKVLGATAIPDGRQAEDGKRGGSESLRELAAYVDPLLGVRRPQQKPARSHLPRLYDEDYAILALLDRTGMALPGMIRRAVMPHVAERTMRGRINDKLHRHGLLARWPIILRDAPPGSLPYLYSLTRLGMQVAQQRQPAAIPPSREFREMQVEKDGRIRHDLHLLSWVIELHEQLGHYATDKWRTPRWPAGRCPVPQTGNGRNRRPISLHDVRQPKHVAIFDVDSEDFAAIEPDAICEIHVPEQKLSFDLFVEMDLTDRVSYNREKFRRYDAFLCGWWSELRRYRQLDTRPSVVFVCSTPEMAMTYARAADRELSGSIGITGSSAHDRYYPARDHLYFVAESDIHDDRLDALALPALPPDVREALDGNPDLSLRRVLLFPQWLTRPAQIASSESGREGCS